MTLGYEVGKVALLKGCHVCRSLPPPQLSEQATHKNQDVQLPQTSHVLLLGKLDAGQAKPRVSCFGKPTGCGFRLSTRHAGLAENMLNGFWQVGYLA